MNITFDEYLDKLMGDYAEAVHNLKLVLLDPNQCNTANPGYINALRKVAIICEEIMSAKVMHEYAKRALNK